MAATCSARRGYVRPQRRDSFVGGRRREAADAAAARAPRALPTTMRRRGAAAPRRPGPRLALAASRAGTRPPPSADSAPEIEAAPVAAAARDGAAERAARRRGFCSGGCSVLAPRGVGRGGGRVRGGAPPRGNRLESALPFAARFTVRAARCCALGRRGVYT